MERDRLVFIGVFVICLIFAPVASATVYLDNERIEVEGVVYNQNIVRSNDFNKNWDFIQGRTQADLKLLFHPIGEKGYLKNLWIIDGIDVRVIGRGVYDYLYDVTTDWGHSGGFFSKDVEKGIKEDFEFREAYADIHMGPLTFRLGRQQIVWGKTDFFRLLDIINPLDYSWHYFFESFDDIRIPQWMAKGLLSLGTVGFVKDLSLEFVLNPRDFNSTNLGRFGEPWALAPAGFESIRKFKPDHEQYGGRLQARIGEFSFTVNDYYTYQQNPVFNLQKGGLVYPRINVFGGAVDYYDNFTKSVLRAEATYTHDMKLGVDFSSYNLPHLLAKNPSGLVEKDVVQYCIGIDRPTWIRFLNPTSTVFLSAQLFMVHVLDHENGLTLDGSPVNSVKPTVTFLANSAYMNGRLTPQVYWAYDLQGQSHVVGPSIQYLLSNNFSVKVGANIIWGSKSRFSTFGAVKDDDELYVKFQFSF